jgi:hypothetical protein
MKYLGVVYVILEIKVFRTFDRLILCQFYYLEKIPYKFSKSDNNMVKIPMDISAHLSKNKSKGN